MIDVVVVRNRGRVERIVKKMESGAIEEVKGHLPWFVSLEMPRDDPSIVSVREEPISFYAFNESRWRYEKVSDYSFIVRVSTPGAVRRISEEMMRMRKRVSMNNVRYEARVSQDLSDSLFGVRVPLPLHYGFDELEEAARSIISRSPSIRLLAFDIEVKSEGRFPRPGDEVFILSACVGELGSDKEECFVLEGDEIHEFLKYARQADPHYLVGFNSRGFDIPYLVAYAEHLRDRLLPTGIVDGGFVVPHVDTMEVVYRHNSAFDLPAGARLALDDIAERLGLASEREIEIEASVDRNRIWVEYQRDREKVVRYAETDARLTLRLGKLVLRVLLHLYALTGISPSVIQLLPTLGSLAEYTVIDNLFRAKRMVLECRWKRWEAKELEKGIGFYKKGSKNFCAKPGLYEKVAYYDFHMLYPSIYNEYRLDPTSVELGSGFDVYLIDAQNEKRVIRVRGRCNGGPVYEVLSYFYNARKVSKKLKSEGFKEIDTAIKILANSAYGMFSKVRGCGVNEFVSGFIFFKANQILNSMKGYVNSLGLQVVYTDTDSLLVVARDIDPESLAVKLTRVAKARFGESFSVKLETVCRLLAIVSKKTYVCLSDDGELIIKGMDRLEIPVAVKERLEEVWSRVLAGEPPETVVMEILASAPTRDLFVKASKRLRELIRRPRKLKEILREDADRFKEPNANRTKAVILKHLYDNGVRLDGYVPFRIDRASLGDYPVISYYLRWGTLAGKKAIAVLLDESGNGATVARCALLEHRPTKDYLEGVFVCREARVGREELVNLALKTMSRLLDYLKLASSWIAKGTTLDRWMK